MRAISGNGTFGISSIHNKAADPDFPLPVRWGVRPGRLLEFWGSSVPAWCEMLGLCNGELLCFGIYINYKSLIYVIYMILFL